MIPHFSELIVGDVLVAPMVIYAGGALAILATMRPILKFLQVDAAFSNPPLALLCLALVILAILIVLA